MSYQYPIFNQAIDWLFSPAIEGREYHQVPGDRGGETKFGISKRAHPDLDIPGLTDDQALAVYHKDYWLQNNCHKLPPALGWALFGGVVNHKPATAIRLLQQSLGVKADGINGPRTQAVAEAADPAITLVDYCSRRARFYHQIVLSDHTQAKFIRGWMKRLFHLQHSIHNARLL
ncbi:MAG: glycosyl hydrolase 108 family protein [Candidatus Sedimenticola sp. (ex Thyasira tokunagai)]